MPLPTLDDLKAHIQIPASNTRSDAELLGFLDAAVDVAEGIVGSLSVGTVTERIAASWDGVAVLQGRPTGLVVLNGGAVTGHTVNGAAGLIYDVPRHHGTLTATYSVADTPASVRLAILIIAAHLWETQRGSQPLPLQGADDVPVDNPTYAPGIPPRARILLESYAHGSQVA